MVTKAFTKTTKVLFDLFGEQATVQFGRVLDSWWTVVEIKNAKGVTAHEYIIFNYAFITSSSSIYFHNCNLG